MSTGTYKLPSIPPIRLLPRDAFLASTGFVPFKGIGRPHLRRAHHAVSARHTGDLAGGRDHPEVIDYLALEKKAGVKMQGPTTTT